MCTCFMYFIFTRDITVSFCDHIDIDCSPLCRVVVGSPGDTERLSVFGERCRVHW